VRTFKAIRFSLKLNNLTAEHYESQFWNQFDEIFGLTEKDMRNKLPLFIADPYNAEALMEEKT